jgi:hypothetical protein
MRDNCPHCNASWIGAPIPEQHRENYGGHTHFNDAIAIIANDRVVCWECPDCHSRFKAYTWERQTVKESEDK